MTLPFVRDVLERVTNEHYNGLPAMKDVQDWSLYDLWRIASSKGYSLRLEGEYIRLVPLTTQGDAGLPRTFRWNNDGIKTARAWLEAPDMPQRVAAVHGAGN